MCLSAASYLLLNKYLKYCPCICPSLLSSKRFASTLRLDIMSPFEYVSVVMYMGVEGGRVGGWLMSSE